MNNYSSFKAIIDLEILINSKFSISLALLLKQIFFKNVNKNHIGSLNEYIEYINEKIIKNKVRYINDDYTIKNFDNIINFVKCQNRVFAGEILEGILIIIFSETFKIDQDCTLNKYIFNNLSKIRHISINEFVEWIKEDKFNPPELRNIRQLLSMEKLDSCNDYYSFSKLLKESPFLHLLFYIYKEKYKHIYTQNKNNKIINYINGGYSNSQIIYNKIYKALERNNSGGIYEKDIIDNSIENLLSNVYYVKNPGETEKLPFSIIKLFFISVFIYYQNKNSPLIKYIGTNIHENKINENRKEELINIPFEYNLIDAYIEGRFANIIYSPIRIEPRISELNMTKNNMRECGLYDLSKTLIFNKNIKSIDNKYSLIRSTYIDYMNFGF